MLGLLGAIILTIPAIGAFHSTLENPEMLIAATIISLHSISLFLLFFVLGTAGAKDHFRVICPDCGNSKVKGSDFLFNKVICRKCNAKWS